MIPGLSGAEAVARKLEISALGLDVGRKRIGVAGCDRTGLIATGLTTIYRQSFDQVVAELTPLIQERRVDLLVVGLPYTMDGKEGAQARQVRRFAGRLGRVLTLPVVYADERLSSVEAKDLIRQRQHLATVERGVVDRKAAALILQRWLDQRRQVLRDGCPE